MPTNVLKKPSPTSAIAETPPPPQLTEEERKAGLMSLAGCWADDPEDAARMEAAIKECRKNDTLSEVNMD
ncbi:MAG: hypothetical protein K6D37_00470 [Prevotella sp.]|nr:hypothetical protein [Prevotella sp.]